METNQQPSIRLTMLPKDTNGVGTIFGGVILSNIDLAGAVEVRRHTAKKVVTVSVKEVKFLSPVFVGDIVSFYTQTTKVGNTSITVEVRVVVDRWKDGYQTTLNVTEATVVYVAVDENNKPISIRN
ncbi:acyl-CoA thioesterase [Candidatus Uabimicrobium amorphum]|uniref:Acyl-CoA thioesterase n=1 Tax=Uabimicrobium amorphum TaxID=2596890 RepID=A0A5S9IJM4_UABAM|nr:acyl-CoA thioesterase [Candidatus Uabimicrobium amorphum]BBM82676.1 acyl-CoA thioesterase [Candidatus Uabimicrobium amorphum]